MRHDKLLQTITLCCLMLALRLTTAKAQTAIWTGATGGEWNTPGNWDVGVPGVGTNALINVARVVNYTQPMISGSFAGLTNLSGTLNINTNGFMLTASGASAVLFYGAGKMYITNGGVMGVTNGGMVLTSNSTTTVSAGGSFTVKNTLAVGMYGNSSGGGGAGFFTNNAGIISLGGLTVNNGSGNQTCLAVINGGTNDLGAVTVQRSAASSAPALGAEGLVINSGVVRTTSIDVGGGSGNSWLSMYLKDGFLTNAGNFTVRFGNTALRFSRFVQAGGIVVSTNTSVHLRGQTGANNGWVQYSVTGGTNLVGGFVISDTGDVHSSVFLTNNAKIYVGSGGFSMGGTLDATNVALNGNGIFGALADWTGTVPMIINGGTMDAADLDGNAHNITIAGSLRGTGTLTKTGAGTLTLSGANSQSGGLTINAGTLALVNDGATTFGALASSPITVGSGANLDVSQANGFVLASSKTIAGVGTITGAFAAGSNSIISPAGIGAQGKLTFASGLAATNANFKMELGSDPTGLITANDSVNVTGDLTLSGTNIVAVTPVGSLGIGTYKLIKYSGNLMGDLSNLICSSGTLVLNPGEIDLIVTSVRPTAGLVWRGDGAANLWDTATSSNWLNGVSYDRFYIGDTNVFDDSTTNFVVNLSGVLSPAAASAVLINATNNYTFTSAGGGDIAGTTALIKTNSGSLTILNDNDYTGLTALSGGTVVVASLANGGLASPLGAASSASANLVFNNGTLEFTGGNKTIDRGATLQAAGGTLNISNAATTLTISGALTGPGALTKTGSGQLSLSGASDYSGGTLITAGAIRAAQGSSVTISALGTSTLTLNGGSGSAAFNFGGDVEVLNNPLNIVGGNNFITNGGNDQVLNLLGSGTVSLEGTGANVLTIAGDMSTFSGTLLVDTLPTLRFLPNSGSVVGGTNATINLGTGNGLLNNRNGNLTVLIGTLLGGASTVVQGGSTSSSDNRGTTYIIGGGNQSSEFDGVISESTSIRRVSLVKAGTGTFTISGNCTYTGLTTVSNGVLALIGSGAQPNTTNLTIQAGAVLDVSGRSDATLSLNNNQVLRGNGSIRGSVTLAAGATLSPANTDGAIGSLTITNDLTLQSGSSNLLDLDATLHAVTNDVVIAAAVTYGGTLNLNTIAGTLANGQSFKLFKAQSYAGAFEAISPATPGNGLAWDTSNLAINGTLAIVTAQPFGFKNITTSGSDIILNATGGTASAAVSVLTSTNLALPLAQWTTVTSGNFDASGNYSYTVSGALSSGEPQQFYILLK